MAFSPHPLILSLLLLLSLSLLFIFSPHFLPPKTLPRIPPADEASDLALFRRATLTSFSNNINSHSSRRRPPAPPKVAFLFLTNTPLAFAPLWELFFAGHSKLLNIYVHADPTTGVNQIPSPSPSFSHRFITAKPTQRASPTLISAARRLLAAALLDDPANAFFALISQTDIPLHSFRYLYHSLLADPGAPSASPLRRRHRSFIEILSGDINLHDRYVARGDNVMMPEVPFSEFRVGSQFFVLARRHAVMVVRDRRLWKKFRMPCLKAMEDSCYPEEHYFPTLLSMQDREGCTGYTLTRVNWTDSVGGHPHMYHPPEVNGELIRELRKSNSTYSYLFARKFSAECLEPLMGIANTVIFKDS